MYSRLMVVHGLAAAYSHNHSAAHLAKRDTFTRRLCAVSVHVGLQPTVPTR